MNILVLTTDLDYTNGWGRYSRDLVKYLSKEGVGVIPIVSKTAQNTPHTYKRLLPNANDFWSLYVFAPYYAWGLKKYAKNCDLIHCFAEPYSVIAFWLSKFTNKKYILTTHGTYGVLPYRQSFLRSRIHHFSFKYATKNICVSSYTKDILSKYSLKNLIIINNGVDIDNMSFDNPDFRDREDIILTVGALKRRKGQHISIDAFAKISLKYPNLKYILVGDQSDTEYVNKLKEQIRESNIENRVEFLSNVSDNDLVDLYKKTKIFVLTSISKKAFFEGFGLVYLEANMYGLPVIGCRDTGAIDAISDEYSGYLVQSEKSDKIVEKMTLLLSDEQKWLEMSKNGVLWAQSHSWSKIIKEYVKIYGTL